MKRRRQRWTGVSRNRAWYSSSPGPVSPAETILTRGLLGSLGPGTVVLADRNFYSFALWNEARATGADFLWRTKSNHVLPVEERLDDGSYLSQLQEVGQNHRRRSDVVVRLIEYTLENPGSPDADGLYRLITTILDPGEDERRSGPPQEEPPPGERTGFDWHVVGRGARSPARVVR